MLYKPTNTQRTTRKNAEEVSFQIACLVVVSNILCYS